MKSILKAILPLSLLFLLSCKGSFYRPVDIHPEAFLTLDSTNTVFVFSVPADASYHPTGAVVKDNGDILKVYLVKAHDTAESAQVDVKVGLVRDDSMLLSRGYKPTSYFLTLPTKGRGFRFCNQGGCGDLNTPVENEKVSKEEE